MKRTLMILAALGALLLVSGFGFGATSESNTAVTVKIPFAFYAGNQQMPAGEYRIAMPRMGGFAIGSMLQVTSPDGSLCQYLFSTVGRPVTNDTDYHLIFNKYGDTYFLSRVRNSDRGAELAPSRVERRLSNEYSKTSPDVGVVDLTIPDPRVK